MSILRGATKRFVEETFLIETDECILWPFSLDKRGYPQAKDSIGFYKPHRRVCEMLYGKAPTGKHHGAHQCGVKACINKRHLMWKTAKENEQDKHRHGTYAKAYKRKLNESDVREIRTRAGLGETITSIAYDYPVTRGALSKILSYRTYQDIP